MSRQVAFGGIWTEKKLQVLSKYLREYRKIFARNIQASYFEVTYLDAFAGTGRIPKRRKGQFETLLPELQMADEEFRKGSVRRALEIDPPFHHYVFVEKHTAKCDELSAIAREFPKIDITVVNSDANDALLKWSRKLNRNRERAVVFMDPFGTAVEWSVLKALAETQSVDLWILFPCASINRMLPSRRKPPRPWSARLTRVLGTDEWEKRFYTTRSYETLLETGKAVKQLHKTADYEQITAFFVERMRKTFFAVADPGYLINSKGPLFALIFAAGNSKGANAGLRIADYLLRRID